MGTVRRFLKSSGGCYGNQFHESWLVSVPRGERRSGGWVLCEQGLELDQEQQEGVTMDTLVNILAFVGAAAIAGVIIVAVMFLRQIERDGWGQ